jgi:hypothetical protein
MSAAGEAKPSRGPGGPAPCGCGEADTWIRGRSGKDQEAEA